MVRGHSLLVGDDRLKAFFVTAQRAPAVGAWGHAAQNGQPKCSAGERERLRHPTQQHEIEVSLQGGSKTGYSYSSTYNYCLRNKCMFDFLYTVWAKYQISEFVVFKDEVLVPGTCTSTRTQVLASKENLWTAAMHEDDSHQTLSG